MNYDVTYMDIFNKGYYCGLSQGLCDALLCFLLFFILGFCVFLFFSGRRKK